jgi:uncharacterized protein
MTLVSWLILVCGGLVSGLLAGLLGIGGGAVLVPFLVALGYQPASAIATSSLAILVTSISGSIQNWRMGYLDFKRVLYLGLPALVTTQLGVYLVNSAKSRQYILLCGFGFLLLINIYLVKLRSRLAQAQELTESPKFNPLLAYISTGGLAGFVAGLFGVGGGVIMVPLQMLLLKEPIKLAIQTSLGVVVLTAIAASIGHGFSGNILFTEGLALGCGGLIGAQISTRSLPKLSDDLVNLIFRLFLAALAIFSFWLAWKNYSS